MTGLAGTHWHPALAEARAAATTDVDPAAAQPGALAEFIVRGPERIALVGPNGAGKTTLLRAITSLAGRPGLDEPTNNLDMASVRQLSQALEGYRGAILVASHDVPFLRSAGITRWLRLDREAGLTTIDPL